MGAYHVPCTLQTRSPHRCDRLFHGTWGLEKVYGSVDDVLDMVSYWAVVVGQCRESIVGGTSWIMV